MARADVEPPRRRAAVFDIDGTLTATNAVDDECFVRALAEVFEVDVAALDWSAAPHMTDEGLLMWLAERHGRAPVTLVGTSRSRREAGPNRHD